MKIKEMSVAKLIEQTRAADANPGGGALLILDANLAMNLMLMMDKKDWEDKSEKASVSRETILELSETLTSAMQDDVDEFASLMDAYKDGSIKEEHYLNAAKPLLTMIDTNFIAMEVLSFYLEFGKSSTISDGEIANELLMATTRAAFTTIRLNIDNTNHEIDYIGLMDKANALYEKNKELIERRKN